MSPMAPCVAAAALALALPAIAQTYPARSIRMVVPYAPGSTTDTLARLLGQKLTDALGQQIVIDNRAGAGGNIGTDIVARATPDGYTLVVVPGSHAINASLYQKLPFDAIRDFTAIAQIGSAPLLVGANPNVPAASMRELLAAARTKPGSIRYASGGAGSPSHLSMELLKSMAGIDLVHVPYKGGGSVLNALVSGEVQITPAGLLVLGPLARAGRIRLLATSGAKRLPAMPELPTIAESGVPGYAVTAWWGVLAPAGLPRPILQRLNGAIVRVLEAPDIRERLANDAIEAAAGTPEAFAAFLRSEVELWAKVVRASGARAD